MFSDDFRDELIHFESFGINRKMMFFRASGRLKTATTERSL